jgi:hypothetical protein
MAARTFKRYVASVKRPASCFEGFTTVIDFQDGREVAIFAATKRMLSKACASMAPLCEIDPNRFQKVVYFMAKSAEKKRS